MKSMVQYNNDRNDVQEWDSNREGVWDFNESDTEDEYDDTELSDTDSDDEESDNGEAKYNPVSAVDKTLKSQICTRSAYQFKCFCCEKNVNIGDEITFFSWSNYATSLDRMKLRPRKCSRKKPWDTYTPYTGQRWVHKECRPSVAANGGNCILAPNTAWSGVISREFTSWKKNHPEKYQEFYDIVRKEHPRCRHLDVIYRKIISKWRSTCDGKYQKYNINPKNVKWMGGGIWKFPILHDGQGGYQTYAKKLNIPDTYVTKI